MYASVCVCIFVTVSSPFTSKSCEGHCTSEIVMYVTVITMQEGTLRLWIMVQVEEGKGKNTVEWAIKEDSGNKDQRKVEKQGRKWTGNQNLDVSS